MGQMYNIIKQLCDDKGITVTQMCKELSITRSCLSELSNGRTETLSTNNTNKIAKYFSVSTQFLAGEQDDDSLNDIKFALFNGSEGVTDEMLDEVREFAKMVKLREEEKRRNGGKNG